MQPSVLLSAVGNQKKKLLSRKRPEKDEDQSLRNYTENLNTSPKLNHKSLVSNICNPNKSMMGYDWIAGMLDNQTPIEDLSDQFFKEIEEFRRLNRDDCKNSKVLKSPREKLVVEKINFKPEEKKVMPLCCKGDGVYVLNDRLHPVPIHGPYSKCPTCKTKQINLTDEPRVRVSIPLSKIQLPYKLRPHRRKSFDPSESLALSTHCLAGWQNSKPSYTRGPESMDLITYAAKTGLKSFKTMNERR